MRKYEELVELLEVNTSDCAKGQMHDQVAQRYVKTMPGGFIA